MNGQYSIVNECLKLVRRKDFNLTQKVRIEVQLNQLKRMLINGDWDDAAGDAFIVSLLAVCRSIPNLQPGGSDSVAFEEDATGLQRIIGELNGGKGSNGGGGCMYHMNQPPTL